MTFRSPTHAWADRLGRPAALAVIASAAVATRTALDALSMDDIDLASRLWSSVNGPELLDLWNAPVGAVSGLVVEPPVEALPTDVRPVHASRAMSQRVFERDGHRCQYCAIPVVTRWKNGDIPKLVAAMPELTPTVRLENGELWGSGKGGALRNVDEAKWMWQKAVVDHVLPASRYGPTTVDNLVTACAGCNYEKMDFTLAQLNVADPRIPAK